jgi:hypothetical protein
MSSLTTNSMLSNLTPTQIRLYEKQQEHASLQALKEASGQMLERVEELARMSHVMADGGVGECFFGQETIVDIRVSGGVLIRTVWVMRDVLAVGSVLRNWNQVFSILNLFGGSVLLVLRRHLASLVCSAALTCHSFSIHAE